MAQFDTKPFNFYSSIYTLGWWSKNICTNEVTLRMFHKYYTKILHKKDIN